MLCRDKCLGVGSCSHRGSRCLLSVPGTRIQEKLVEGLLPRCVAPTGGTRKLGLSHSLGQTVQRKHVGSTLIVLRAFLNNIPCAGRGCDRKRFRAVLCIVFGLIDSFIILARIHATAKQVSVIIHAGARVCLFRLGFSNSTRRTLRRVSVGGCTTPFTLSSLPVMGINIGFSSTAHAVSD